jgi:hypothetical protein
LILAAIALVLMVWGAVVALLLFGAVRDLEAGRDAAVEARDGLDIEGVADLTPIEPLRTASAHFADAEDATSNPLLAPIKVLPIVGRQLQSVHALSSAAADATSAAAEGLDGVGAALAMSTADGPSRLAQVTALNVAAESTYQKLAAIDDLGPSSALLGPIDEAHDELADELSEATQALADAASGARAAQGLLQGPRRYLLVAANNAEMRAGSGMWLSGGVLATANGELDLGEMRSLTDADLRPEPGSVTSGPLSQDYLARWSWAKPEEEWRNLMLSPDFPASAQLAAGMWQSVAGETVDGVLSVDPVALAAVLRATGPVQVDGREVSADQVVPELLHDQYVSFGDSPRETVARRDQLGRIAEAAFTALDAGNWDPAVLAKELASAVQGRHLMAWSPNEVEQAGWVAAHMDGGLGDRDLSVAVLNTSATKTDWFLRTNVVADVTSDGTESEIVLQVKVSNQVPDGEPQYIVGPAVELVGVLGAGDHRGIVAVNVPGAARGLSIDGVETPVVHGKDGVTQVIAHQVIVRKGEEQTFVVRFRLPVDSGSIDVVPSARSSATTWDFRHDSWQDTKEHALNW